METTLQLIERTTLRSCVRRVARPARPQVEFSGDGEHRVTDGLGFQTARRPAPQMPVLWVALCILLIRQRAAAIGRTCHDEAMKRFRAPAAFPQFTGEPVKERLVR